MSCIFSIFSVILEIGFFRDIPDTEVSKWTRTEIHITEESGSISGGNPNWRRGEGEVFGDRLWC